MPTVTLDLESIGPFVFDNPKDYTIENYPHRVRVDNGTEVSSWCYNNLKPRDWTIRMPHFAFVVDYCFRNGDDATAFKLRFLSRVKPSLAN